MDIAGEWTIEYVDSPNELHDSGEKGSFVLLDGKLTGKDQYGSSIDGAYTLKGAAISARVRVTSEDEDYEFIFDDVPNPFTLDIKGVYSSPDSFLCEGVVRENRKHKLVIRGSRKTEVDEKSDSRISSEPVDVNFDFGRSNLEVVPPATFRAQDLKKLFAVLLNVSEHAANLEVAALQKADNQSNADFEKLKRYVRDLCRLRVFVTSADGDMFSSYDEGIFESPTVPRDLKLIVFDSSPDFQYQAKRRPENWTRLELDLSKPKILDLNLSPSESTPNGSSLVVEGSDSTWANLSFQRIRNVMKESYSHRGWLHQKNVFDIYFLVCVLPLTYLVLTRIEIGFSNFFLSLSRFQYFFTFIYIFLLITYCFRIFFNYTRSVFPYIEIDSDRSNRNLTRIVWGIITTSVAGGLVWSLFTYIAKVLAA